MEATAKKPATDEFSVKERKRWLFFGIPWTFTTYTLNNKKLILKEGFFSTTENEILLYRVLDITLRRNLFQRMFGLGSVIVEAQDKTHAQLVIKNIKRSQKFRELLSDAVEADKIRLRLRRGELIDFDGDFDGDDGDNF